MKCHFSSVSSLLAKVRIQESLEYIGVYMNGLLHEISVFVSSARSDGSGELLHMHMLSRAFATRIITQSINVDEGLDLNIDL